MKVTNYVCGGKTRCLQAAFRMVVWALVGSDPGAEASDRMTGYVEGRGTWQFRMLLAFTEYGLNAIDHEEFNVQEFINDPEAAIRRQVKDEESVLGILRETDTTAEREALRKCVASPYVSFVESAPSFRELQSEIDNQRLVIVSLNLKVLQGEAGREGHMLIIEQIGDDFIVVHDPGPHGGLERKIPRGLFEEAWTSPSAAMANYISVWRRPHVTEGIASVVR